MDFNTARRKYEYHKTKRANVESAWEQIQKYVLPFRALFYTDITQDEQSVNWRRREVYDDTAIDAAQSLAATISSNLINPVVRWFEIVVKDKTLGKLQEVKAWLEEVSERMFQTLQGSNFNLSANEMNLDLVGFGTASLLQETTELPDGRLDKMVFKAMPVDQCFFDEDENGKPINFYRMLVWTPLQMVEKFGKDAVPKDIADALTDPIKSSRKYKILFVVFRRHDIPLDGPRPVAPLNRPYGAKYYMYEGAQNGEELLGPEFGYYDMPVFIPRWRKTSGSQWGYSPAMTILSNIMSLNKMQEILLKGNEKIVDPPILSTKRGIIGRYDMRAGQVTLVKSLDAIQQWQHKGRLDFSFMQKEDMQRQIKEAFFMDQLQLKESPAMTATEVSVRYELMQKLLGPSVGQIQYDALGPMLERTFQLLLFYRQLPPPPDVLMRPGVALDIEYLGPMAKAQRQDTMVAIERWMMAILQAAQTFPEALDIPNIDELVTELGYAAGVPAKIINSKAAIMAARLQKQQEQAQMKQLAMAESMSKTQAQAQAAA
jgi:hypothetical protein